MKTKLFIKLFTRLSGRQASFLVASGMFFLSVANAQIVYTDVNPDQTFTNGNYNLDLNNDGISDFTINIKSVFHTVACGKCGSFPAVDDTISIVPLASNEVISHASKLHQNTLIDSNLLFWSNKTMTMAKLSWKSNGCLFGGDCTLSPKLAGDWSTGDTDKYLGLRVKIDSHFYYGWVRVNVSNWVSYNYSVFHSFTIKDYAFNSVPGASILAGQLPCPLPSIVVTHTGQPVFFCNGDSVALTANLWGAYQWKVNGNNIPGATSEAYEAKATGMYSVRITNNGCSKTSAAITVTANLCAISVLRIPSAQQLTVGPNPASDKITLSFSSIEKGTLQINNLMGQIIFSGMINSQSKEIDVSQFSKGIYLVTLKTSDGNFESKFLEQ